VTSARQRPATARAIGDGLKLHRHVARLDGHPYTVITLRPGTTARFATNNFHGTWHILTDLRGARLLARLAWGLAYQRAPGTVVLVDRAFLDTDPFEGNPSDPVALLRTDLTRLTATAGRELRRFAARVTAPTGTVRWRTPGLDRALAEERAWLALPPHRTPPGPWRPRTRNRNLWAHEPYHRGEVCERLGGVVTFGARSDVLRDWAMEWHSLHGFYRGADSSRQQWPGGEVQVWEGYADRVSAARQGRREVLASGAAPGVTSLERRRVLRDGEVEPPPLGCTLPGQAPVDLPPADLGPLIWSAGARIGRRMATARHRPGPRGDS